MIATLLLALALSAQPGAAGDWVPAHSGEVVDECGPNQLCLAHELTFSPDGSRLAAAVGPMVQIFDVSTGERMWAQSTPTRGFIPPAFVRDLVFSIDGERLYTAGDEPLIRVWSAQSGALVETIELDRPSFALALDPQQERFAVTTRRGAEIRDLQTGAVLAAIEERRGVTELAFTPDGSRLVLGTLSNRAVLVDAATGAPVAELEGHRRGADQMYARVSPAGGRVVTAGEGEEVVVWEATDGSEVMRYARRRDTLAGPVFSPDGAMIVVGDGRRRAVLVDAQTSAAQGEIIVEGLLAGLAWSPDGATIAVGVSDEAVVFFRRAEAQAADPAP
ncbi:MAG: WD40 repeat domain-containing protein [Oceanicaulis sp.]